MPREPPSSATYMPVSRRSKYFVGELGTSPHDPIAGLASLVAECLLPPRSKSDCGLEAFAAEVEIALDKLGSCQ